MKKKNDINNLNNTTQNVGNHKLKGERKKKKRKEYNIKFQIQYTSFLLSIMEKSKNQKSLMNLFEFKSIQK